MNDATKTKYVLVHENRDLVRALRPEMLTRRGVNLTLFATGSQAIERAGERAPALCVTPLNLPDMAGRDLAARIRDLYGKVPVVAVLTDEDVSNRVQVPEIFSNYLVLPVDPNSVRILVARLMGLRLRAAERFPIRVRVYTDEYLGTTMDLSSTGMLVRADREMPQGAEVELKFALPGSADRMQVRARVARVDHETVRPQVAVALEFDPGTFHARKELDAYISSLVAGRTFHWTFNTAGAVVVSLGGRLKDPSDLLELSSHMEGPATLDLSGLSRIDTRCRDVWQSWLRGLDRGQGVPISTLSYELAVEAADDPGLMKHGVIGSIMVPHVCDACGLENLVAIAVPERPDDSADPVTCPKCGGVMVPDEVIPAVGKQPSE
ncbi:MAG: response regulator [Deltaproteobacteria bacterium]|nr:response regulator [Deltaproteobacteria bacterium]